MNVWMSRWLMWSLPLITILQSFLWNFALQSLTETLQLDPLTVFPFVRSWPTTQLLRIDAWRANYADKWSTEGHYVKSKHYVMYLYNDEDSWAFIGISFSKISFPIEGSYGWKGIGFTKDAPSNSTTIRKGPITWAELPPISYPGPAIFVWKSRRLWDNPWGEGRFLYVDPNAHVLNVIEHLVNNKLFPNGFV